MINLCMQPLAAGAVNCAMLSLCKYRGLVAIMYSSKDISVYNTKYNNVLPITLLIIITNVTF